MAKGEIYFGGADEQSPIAAPSTSDWRTVNPPQVQAEAWEFERARRAAERQREMEDMIFREAQNAKIDDVTKAVQAAQQFQAQRGYQTDLANGVAPNAALAKWAPMLFKTPAGLGQVFRPSPARVMNVSGTGYQEQPDGTWKPFTPVRPPKPPTDATAADLRRRIAAAQKEVDDAQMKFEAHSATTEEIIPGRPPSKIFGLIPWGSGTPAVTNRVPVYMDTSKAGEFNALRDAAKKRLESARAEYTAYMQNATNAPAAEIPPMEPIVAPTSPQVLPPPSYPDHDGNVAPMPATVAPSPVIAPPVTNSPPAASAVPAPAPVARPASGNGLGPDEVLRRANGRLAIFNAKTRKFLRYAD